jgi:hypothetical protein
MIMKKVKLFLCGIAAVGAGLNVNLNSHSNSSGLSDVFLANVEALSTENNVSNTGPGKESKCKGLFGLGGTKKICMCTNQYTCTESDCY